MKKKQAVAFLLSTTMAVGGAVQAFGASSDISGHWAQATITKWQDAGRIGGYEDGTFKPDRTITRAEFVRLLNSATSTSFTSSASVNFSDVKESDWFYADVAKAVGAKITSGFEDGTFRPSETVTRMQAAVFICNAKGLAANEAGANLLTDAAEIPAWAKGAVGAVISAGYMSGYPDGSFGGAKGMTRAEAVSTLDRVLGGGVTTPAPDNQGVSTPDTNQDTTIADAKQEGNMVWRSGGGGGGSSSKKDDSEDKKHIDKNVTIASAADVREHKGHTLTGTTTIELTENLELNDITFNGPVKIISKEASSATAAAYIGDDAVVAAANSRIADDKFTITLTNGTKFIESVTVEEGVTNAKPVEIFTKTTEEAEKTISTLIAKIATRIVGFTTTTVEAHASIEIANGSAGTVTAKEKGAAITVEEGATVTTVEVPVDATVTVQGTVDNVAISKEADATVALEGAANVKELTVEGTAKATIAVAEGTEVGKIKITSENKEPATITGDGNAIKEITAKDPAAVNVSGTKNPPEVKPIEGEEDILVTGIEVTADSKEVEIGGELQLKANVTPSNATNKGVTWSITLDASLKEGDVAISTDGLLTVTDAAVENAKITVTATAVDGSNAKGEYEVTVVKKATTGTPEEAAKKALASLTGITVTEATNDAVKAAVNTAATNAIKDVAELAGWTVTAALPTDFDATTAITTTASNVNITYDLSKTGETSFTVEGTASVALEETQKTPQEIADEKLATLNIVAVVGDDEATVTAAIKDAAAEALKGTALETGWTTTVTITAGLGADGIVAEQGNLTVTYDLTKEGEDPVKVENATVTVKATNSKEEAAAIEALTGLKVELAAGATVDAETVKAAIKTAAEELMTGDLAGYSVAVELIDFDATTALTTPVKVTYTLTKADADEIVVTDLTVTVTQVQVTVESTDYTVTDEANPTAEATGSISGKDANTITTSIEAATFASKFTAVGVADDVTASVKVYTGDTAKDSGNLAEGDVLKVVTDDGTVLATYTIIFASEESTVTVESTDYTVTNEANPTAEATGSISGKDANTITTSVEAATFASKFTTVGVADDVTASVKVYTGDTAKDSGNLAEGDVLKVVTDDGTVLATYTITFASGN